MIDRVGEFWLWFMQVFWTGVLILVASLITIAAVGGLLAALYGAGRGLYRRYTPARPEPKIEEDEDYGIDD